MHYAFIEIIIPLAVTLLFCISFHTNAASFTTDDILTVPAIGWSDEQGGSSSGPSW